MHRSLIILLALTSFQSGIAMQKLRSLVRHKPLTSIAFATTTTSIITYGSTNTEVPLWLKNPVQEYRMRKIEKTSAEELAQMRAVTESDR